MTQKDRILNLLRKSGNKGISSFGQAREIALQLPTRIFELKQAGYNISSIEQKEGSTQYILLNEPQKKDQEQVREKKEYFYIGNVAYLKREPEQGVLI